MQFFDDFLQVFDGYVSQSPFHFVDGELDVLKIKKWLEKTVGTFVGRLLQNSGKLWVIPTPSSTHKILATH